MLYNCKLNLPKPLTSTMFEQIVETRKSLPEHHYLYISNEIDILAPELLRIFQQLDLTPAVTIMFGFANRTNYTDTKHIIHSDIVYHNDTWVNQPFAIHWELSSAETNFYWWDTGDTTKCYPSENEPPRLRDLRYLYARGAHYGQRDTFDILPHFRVIESCTIPADRAIAINTSVPHSVIKTVNEQPRCGFSIRFPVEQITSWEQGLKIFKNYIQ